MSVRSGVVLLLLAAGLGAGAGCTRQSPASGQANETAGAASTPSPDEAAPRAPATKAGAVDRSHRGASLPQAALVTLDGQPASLAAYAGKPLLVNLWATWCGPCVAELPSLDRAAAGLATVAINQGEKQADVAAFLQNKVKLSHARTLRDPGMAASMGLGAALPLTILYDGAGKEVWRVAGGRDWTSADSRALLAETGAINS